MRVLKWSVPVDDQPHLIGDGRVVHVACQDPRVDNPLMSVQVWTLESMLEPLVNRLVQVYGTGHPLPDSVGFGSHIGSALMDGGSYVWHIFQVPS